MGLCFLRRLLESLTAEVGGIELQRARLALDFIPLLSLGECRSQLCEDELFDSVGD